MAVAFDFSCIEDCDDNFAQELNDAETKFLSPAGIDIRSVVAFSEDWMDISRRLERAMDQKSVPPSTSSLAHSVANRISILAEGFIKLQLVEDELTSSQMSEMERILSGEDDTVIAAKVPISKSRRLSSSSSRPRTPPSPTPCRVSSTSSNSLSCILPELRTWLLQHLDRPYPSQAIRLDFAARGNVSLKVITDWFAQARRRIGWTSVVNKFFGGNRSLACDSAARTYKRRDADPDVRVPAQIMSEFLKIEKAAKACFDDSNLQASSLALSLGSNVVESEVANPSRRKRGRFDEDESPNSNSQNKRHRMNGRLSNTTRSCSSSSSTLREQPSLTTSSLSGASTPAPATPILPSASLDFRSSSFAQPTCSQTTSLNSLIDDWLATVKSVSPASPADELPLAQGASRKRRNVEQDERETETARKRAKKARVVSESETSTLFDSGSILDEYSAGGLYPTSALETFPVTFPYTDTNTEALYALTSAMEFTVPAPALSSDLLSGNEFGSALEFGNTSLDLGFGLATQNVEDQPLEVGMGSYGFDLTSSLEPHFGFEFGTLPSAPALTDGSLGLEFGTGTDLVSVLQQLHPSTTQERPQPELEAMLPPQPESVPLPAQGAEEVAALSRPEQVTLTLSEEELAALAGCLQGNELDLSEDVFGLGFDALDAPVAAPVSSCLTMPPAIDVESLERDAKLTRLQSLLAEVNQLQQEVFC